MVEVTLRSLTLAALIGAAVLLKPNLRSLGANSTAATDIAASAILSSSSRSSKEKAAPCQCEKANPAWTACTRTVPKCVFIDLGAAHGNSFHTFLTNGYGPVANCPSGQWEAFLVEANPRFNAPLQQLEARFPGQLQAQKSTAAFCCEVQPLVEPPRHAEGRPSDCRAAAALRSVPDEETAMQRSFAVSSPRMMGAVEAVARQVLVKMDIEGSEFDILPCLAEAPSASLMDRFYIEEHSPSWSLTGASKEAYDAAKAKLKQRGVKLPRYFSHTL